MWWRYLTFCLLVTLILFIVISCIQGRPVLHLFFHRCCTEDIENDQVIFENLGDNFLRERLVGDESIFGGNKSYKEVEVVEIWKIVNVHDPGTRNFTDIESTTEDFR
ncbi:hypothetical protein O3G_MSEX007331 [Manduca sexta]|uniref:Uncharacterized protein n=1 Tax=Manduca sexta TaxID=7130 RepID=A0A921Z6J5_MANSE|nr:hypothetical protein O3G_MSEX007331 [Manduca sexta]